MENLEIPFYENIFCKEFKHEGFGTNAFFSEKVLNTVLITFHLLIIMTESWLSLAVKTTKHEQLVKYLAMTQRQSWSI